MAETSPPARVDPIDPSRSWFSDETSLLGEVRRVVVSLGEVPQIDGYSDMVRLKAGGQAVVYSARQISTGRRVAVKVVHADDERSRLRFSREIELAASLRHPAIVRVYDSGITRIPSGRVYLVMELVEGPSLEQFAEGLSPRKIAELMTAVADAVGYAHLRGVVHRDLKPDNILLDSDGRPRVVDFGLARAEFQTVGADRSSVTVSGQFVGSLAWSSPEHASGKSDAVDTRSDVYSLGVVLYKLLTGSMPYQTGGSLSEALSNIVNAEPATMGRSTTGEPIEADLRTITLTCLNKDPSRRYATGAELSADLRHYLSGEPISARRETAWRTLNRRARRFRAIIAVGTVALIAVGLFAAWSVVQTNRARLAGEETKAALQLAQQREAQAGRVAQFLTTILRAPQPGALKSEANGKDIKVVEILAKAARSIDARFGDDPSIAASLHMAIGQSYRSLSQIDDAETQFDAALRRAEETGDEQIIADALWNKAALLGNTRGRNAEAEPMLRRVLEIRQKIKGPDDLGVLEAKDALATQLQGLAKFDDASVLFKDTMERRARLKGETDGDTISSVNNYAAFLRSQGKLDEALTYFKRAAEGAEKGLGAEHPSALIAWGNYANTLVRLDKADEALPILRRVAAGQEKVNGPHHHHTAGALNQLGGALQYSKPPQKEEAAAVFRRCVAAAEASLGANARNTIAFRNNLATCLSELGQHEEAVAVQRACVAAIVTLRGENHFDTHAMKGNLGRALMEMGGTAETAEAERLLLGAYEGLIKVYGEGHSEVTSRAADLARLYTVLGRPEDAAVWKGRSGNAR